MQSEMLNVVPFYLATIAMLTEQDKVYMADFGVVVLRECCIQARHLTDCFEEMLDLKRAGIFLSSLRGCIIRNASSAMPLTVLRDPEYEKRRFRDLVAEQRFTVAGLKQLASDLKLALYYMEQWQSNFGCCESLASVMKRVETSLDNLRLKIVGLLHEPEGEYNPEFDFDFRWENCAWTEENLASSQKKPDDRACELLAEKAACLVSLADEFCSEHPITMETVQKKILDEWSSGCKRIDMELAAQLLEKSESFAIATHMPCFKALLEESLFRAPVSSSQEAGALFLTW